MCYSEEWNTFFENIRVYRKVHKLSKRQMAKKLHIGTRSLTVLESGRIPPRVSVDIFFYFACLCGVPVSEIFETLQICP